MEFRIVQCGRELPAKAVQVIQQWNRAVHCAPHFERMDTLSAISSPSK